MKRLAKGCGYQGFEFGARHLPDSLCCGGRLFEIDECDGEGKADLRSDEIPCPGCREDEAIGYWVEQFILAGEEPASATTTARSFVAARRKLCISEAGGFDTGRRELSV